MSNRTYSLAIYTIVLAYTMPVTAQKDIRIYDRAEEYFVTQQYEKALDTYLEVLASNPRYTEAAYKAEISLLLSSKGDDNPLDKFLAFEETFGAKDDHYYYWLGKIYSRRYMMDESVKAFEKFHQKATYSGSTNEESTQELIAHSLLLKDYFENPDNYEIKHLEAPINSAFTELSPVFSKDNGELLFASDRYGFGDTPFKIYYTTKENQQWKPIKEVSALGSFTKSNANLEVVDEDGKLFIFSEEKGGDLFYSEPTGDNWKAPQEFDSKISNSEIASHFFINEHEDRILFGKDVSGNGLDIYESFKDPESGKWSKPHPFFSSINTKHNEDSPYLSPDETKLYFCSDRPGGVGGYDVYVSEFNRDDYSWSEPKNMGWPVNSPDNEFNFKMNEEQTSGYFVSDRLHSLGSYDIYSFHEIEKVNVQGRIFDEQTNGPLTDAEIRFHPKVYLDEYFRSPIDRTGRYRTKVIANETFLVEILKNGQVIYKEEFKVDEAEDFETTHIKDFTVNN